MNTNWGSVSRSSLLSSSTFNPFNFSLLSVIVGYRIYKTRYHMTLTLNNQGFRLQEGSSKVAEEKWSSFADLASYITPKKKRNISKIVLKRKNS